MKINAKDFCLFLFVFIFSIGYFTATAPISLNYKILTIAIFLTLLSVAFKKSLLLTILAGIALANFCVSQAQTQSYPPNLNAIATGTVINEPTITNSYQMFLVKRETGVGNVRIITKQFPNFEYGDRLIINGNFAPSQNKKDQTDKIMGTIAFPSGIKKETGQTTDLIVRLRKTLNSYKNHLKRNINQALPEPAAGLATGILFGEKQQLASEVISILIITGTIHIIALSGYNITIVVEFLRSITKHASRDLSFWLPTIGIIIFIFSTGLSASVIRAGIVGELMLLAKFIGRQEESLIMLPLSAALMLALNPYLLLYDIGFQLSFAAFVGIIYLSDLFRSALKIFGASFSGYLSSTIGATIATWPLLAYHFKSFSAIAPITNLFILPLIPIYMLSVFVLAVASLFGPVFRLFVINRMLFSAQYF